MATLRLRDNFAENSWESSIAPGTEENDNKEKKYRKEKGKSRQMPAKNRELHTPTTSSTNENARKKDQYATIARVTKFL